ncbi:MAG: cupin domain-containing protein [Phycisphaerales bacterium]|nr:MAG: cupin domain-containing protein [Phycisphaerales bacterium]
MSQKNVLVIDLNDSPEYQRLLDGENHSLAIRSGRVYLAPAKACGTHSTKDHEELLVFLAGSGELIIEETRSFKVGRGKVSYIPPNTTHDVKNTGNEPLIYIYCVAPAPGPAR